MRKIRISIGSNDGATIAATHLGDTENFYIYDIYDTGASEFVEQRHNTAREMEHAGSDKMKAIIALIADTHVFVARQKSPNFVRIAKQTHYQPVVVKVDTFQEILSLLSGEFDKIYPYVERRRNCETFDTIPELP